MKLAKLGMSVFVASLGLQQVYAQGTFQNLNFEKANPVSVGNPFNPGAVTTVSALPFWGVYYGTVQQTQIEYNAISTGTPQVALVSAANSFFPAIDGNYGVLLQANAFSPNVSISQTGLIPLGSQSLLFEAQPGFGALDVLVGSQMVPSTAVGNGPNYTLYAANISPWAGDSEQITFVALVNPTGQNNWLIDDITFSTVPEPSITTLTTLGGLLLGARKWFARR